LFSIGDGKTKDSELTGNKLSLNVMCSLLGVAISHTTCAILCKKMKEGVFFFSGSFLLCTCKDWKVVILNNNCEYVESHIIELSLSCVNWRKEHKN
jgi:hypothetical protein